MRLITLVIFTALGLISVAGIMISQFNPTLIVELRAELGDPTAQFKLARMYDSGVGEKQSNIKAAHWYSKAADQGYAHAQVDLGVMYSEGTGVPQDYGKAMRLFVQAANQGSLIAEDNIGGSYEYGQGVTQDYNQAAIWYRKAAEENDVEAQFDLGRLYAAGNGVPQNSVEAYKWFILSKSNASAGSSFFSRVDDAMDSISNTMTASQIDQAQRDAAAWQNSNKNLLPTIGWND